MNRNTKFVLIVAGEASADLHGANLVRGMQKLDPGITFWGIGGNKMEDAGVKILASSTDMAVVGLTEVLCKLPRIVRVYLKLKYLLRSNHPLLLILIDYPEFNLYLAKSAKRYKIPVLYYISPQVWAWRKGRIKKIARRVDRMAVVLPFEEKFYRRRGLDVEYVGHPLLDTIPNSFDKIETIKEMGLKNGHPILGLLPGSRTEEIKKLLPLMIKAVEILSSSYPDLKCILPLASTISPDLVQSILRQSSVEIKIFQDNFHKTVSVCELALVASGTATLEMAIMGIPMVILYRISPLSFWVAKMVVKVPHIGLVNLVAGERIASELIQDEVTPQRLVHETIDILKGGQNKENMIKKLRMVREKLGRGGASERTARMAVEMMTRQNG
ncbi:MAG: lipid-A-disaccharide synthase [Desulfatiglandales bacterium]|nr:lipid-A-disaccharide synthase [Desulfatiglandales bacterium]